MSVILDYPIWFIFFCLLAGGLYSFILYRNEKKFEEVPVWIKRLMLFFRFLVVSIISFFLLSPLVKTISREVEKPIIIIAQDNSESIIIGKDSSFYRNEYPKLLNELLGELSDKYDTSVYTFGDKIGQGMKMNFSEKQTDMSALFDEIETRFSNRNVGAIILASDGLYNKGLNPVFSSDKFKIPVYTIALGDTSVKKDILIKNVAHNRYAYLGNSFPFEIVVQANRCKDKNTTLTVSKDGQNLFTQKIEIKNNSFITTIPVQLDAKQAGLQHYRVALITVEDEISVTNNVQDVFIEVLDGRQKILILANSPHPDIAAIKESIMDNDNYEVESYLLSDFKKSISGYNLIILHQLPSTSSSASAIMKEIVNSDIPVLYVIGSQTNLSQFGNMNAGLGITGINKNKTNDAQAIVSKDFTLFSLDENVRAFFPKLPPLVSQFGNYNTAPSANVLLYQRIGSVETKYPLIMYNENLGKKTGVIAGEGIWRWKLFDYSEHSNHTIFNELISKTVQFLSLKVDKSLFRVKAKNNYYENEPVEMDAELYNASYEFMNDPEVSLNIISTDGKKYPYTFSKTTHSYHLNAGVFPVGEYKYEANVKAGDKVYSAKGSFSITALQLEASNTTADHQLLFSLAKKHGGEMLYPNDLKKLAQLINAREDVKSISFTEKKLSDLINIKWIFFLILLLLSLEWFMRKRNGAY